MKLKIAFWVGIAGILIALIYDQITIRKLKKEIQIKAVELLTFTDSVKEYRTKAGKAYFLLKTATIEAAALKESVETLGIEIEGLKSKGINYKKIISILEEQIESMGHTGVIPLVIPKDSTQKIKTFKWTNDFLSLNGSVRELDIQDIEYSYKASLTHVTQNVKGKSIVTVYLNDPGARITTGSQIIVSPVRHWWDKPWIWGLAGAGAGVWLGR
jgi:hypothetical protein